MVVLGSANLDVVLRVDVLPRPGETVLASGREQHPGGKGLNQAVAAARAGARTALVSAVGEDEAADLLLATLDEAGVDATAVRRAAGSSGVATIVVQASGENAIVVDPGAGGTLTALDPAAERAVRAGAVLVAQLEVPLGVVVEAARLALAAGRTVVVNAAPAQPLDAAVLALVDVLVVNEHEALVLAGREEGDPVAAAQRLAAGGPTVVVTLGASGAVVAFPDGRVSTTPGLPARAVDTTAAGDAFVGVLAAALAAGLPVEDGVRRAVAAGALAVEVAGAVPSIPTREAVDARLADQPRC